MDFSRLRAIAFDLDGTLYPNFQIVLPSLRLLLRHFSLLRALEASRRVLRQRGKVSDFYRQQAALVAERLRCSVEEAARLIEEVVYTEWFSLFRGFKLRPGVTQLIQSCRRWGLKTAVMSDFPIRSRLDDLGLGGLWDVAFSAEEVGALKPNPQGFEELCNRLGTQPEEVIYVGNDYAYDVVGAKRAGLNAAHLSAFPPSPTVADLTFHDYARLEGWLREGLSLVRNIS